MTWLALLVALATWQTQYPAPVGYVSDFAGILDAASQRQMLGVIEEVRQKSGGEIAVVTLKDLVGRASIDVARDIGRQWGVGAKGGPGDPAKNAGIVLLLVPGERPGDGKAKLAIATGTGTEGFITDARAGQIRDAIGRVSVQANSYAAGLVAGVWLLAQAYAQEFGFELTGQAPVSLPPAGSPQSFPVGIIWLLFFLLPIVIALAGRGASRRLRYGRRIGRPIGLPELILLSLLSGGSRRRGGGGSWGGGGFSGGGFGGFGGGGGFSGGGASGSF